MDVNDALFALEMGGYKDERSPSAAEMLEAAEFLLARQKETDSALVGGEEALWVVGTPAVLGRILRDVSPVDADSAKRLVTRMIERGLLESFEMALPYLDSTLRTLDDKRLFLRPHLLPSASASIYRRSRELYSLADPYLDEWLVNGRLSPSSFEQTVAHLHQRAQDYLGYRFIRHALFYARTPSQMQEVVDFVSTDCTMDAVVDSIAWAGEEPDDGVHSSKIDKRVFELLKAGERNAVVDLLLSSKGLFARKREQLRRTLLLKDWRL